MHWIGGSRVRSRRRVEGVLSMHGLGRKDNVRLLWGLEGLGSVDDVARSVAIRVDDFYWLRLFVGRRKKADTVGPSELGSAE